MQIVSNGDNLREMSNPVSWGEKKRKDITNLSSAELDKRVVKVQHRAYLTPWFILLSVPYLY